MTVDDLFTQFLSFERRLATIADLALETREQAQHTLDRINRLRRDLERFKQTLTCDDDTAGYQPPPPAR